MTPEQQKELERIQASNSAYYANKKGTQHTVTKGQTLGQIAKQYGVGVSDISGYRSGNANLIFPNEVLSIKDNTSQVSSNAVAGVRPNQYQTEVNVPEPIVPEWDFTVDDTDITESRSDIQKLRDKKLGILNDKKGQLEDADVINNKQKLTKLKSQLDALAIRRKGISADVNERNAGRGMTMGAIRNMTSQELRRNALQALSLQAEGSLLQGDITGSIDLIDEMTNLELEPVEYELETAELNLKSLKDTYKDEHTAYAKSVNTRVKAAEKLLAEKRKDLTNARRDRKDIRTIALEARKNGAPQSVVNAILRGETVEDAVKSGITYLNTRQRAEQNKRSAAVIRERNIRSRPSKAKTTTTSTGGSSWIDNL